MKKEGIGNKKLLAIGLIVMLSIAVLSTTTLAYSEKEKGNTEKGKQKGEKSQTREEKGKSGKDNKNSTTTSQSNTNATVQSSFKSKEHTNEGAKNKTKDGIPLNATLAGLYTGNMNYTLNANGTAMSISKNSTDTNATISLNLSVWKSNKGIVSLKVVNGTITIGDNETHDIHYGKAVLRLKAHKIIITAFVEDIGKPLKLNAKVREDGILPATVSDAPLQLDVLSPQSKLASKWFLKMDGEIALS